MHVLYIETNYQRVLDQCIWNEFCTFWSDIVPPSCWWSVHIQKR